LVPVLQYGGYRATVTFSTYRSPRRSSATRTTGRADNALPEVLPTFSSIDCSWLEQNKALIEQTALAEHHRVRHVYLFILHFAGVHKWTNQSALRQPIEIRKGEYGVKKRERNVVALRCKCVIP
jgi:hypothetical protein